MAVWSSLRLLSSITQKPNLSSLRLLSTITKKSNSLVVPLKRSMSGGGHDNVMKIDVSRWQWHKFKDLLHLYTMVGVIPISLLIFYVNVFIGPATLAEIPEGYTPKYWEYYSHPLTRFFARYTATSHQQEYEKYMHFLYEEDEKMKMRAVSREVRNKMAERHDYEAYYYRPITAKYFRLTKEMKEDMIEVSGDNV